MKTISTQREKKMNILFWKFRLESLWLAGQVLVGKDTVVESLIHLDWKNIPGHYCQLKRNNEITVLLLCSMYRPKLVELSGHLPVSITLWGI